MEGVDKGTFAPYRNFYIEGFRRIFIKIRGPKRAQMGPIKAQNRPKKGQKNAPKSPPSKRQKGDEKHPPTVVGPLAHSLPLRLNGAVGADLRPRVHALQQFTMLATAGNS